MSPKKTRRSEPKTARVPDQSVEAASKRQKTRGDSEPKTARVPESVEAAPKRQRGDKPPDAIQPDQRGNKPSDAIAEAWQNSDEVDMIQAKTTKATKAPMAIIPARSKAIVQVRLTPCTRAPPPACPLPPPAHAHLTIHMEPERMSVAGRSIRFGIRFGDAERWGAGRGGGGRGRFGGRRLC